jgi:ABC-2 type transport system ATP-binding protein
MTASEHAVIVTNLLKRFDSFTAVDGISFSVTRGEVFGFLGPNGAGKSTTIRMLCGILAPTSGTGSVAGFDVTTQPERIKEHIGYMSQKFSLYQDLTVSQNIDFYAGVYGVGPARLPERKAWIIQMAGLAGRENSLTRDLAVGWKQRLALGCAVVHEPQIVFLDEPTAGVDPLSRRNFWNLIEDISSRGVTVFVTTHYMDEAEHCDRLGLIHAGKLVALGTPAELKQRYMAGTLLEVACDPLMQGLEILRRHDAAKDVAVFGAALHVVVETPEAQDVIRQALQNQGIAVTRIQQVLPSLEDVFVSLIGD